MKPRLPLTEAKSKGQLCLKSFTQNMRPFYRLHNMYPPIYIQIQLCAYLTPEDCSRTSTSPAANAKRLVFWSRFQRSTQNHPSCLLGPVEQVGEMQSPPLILTSFSVHFLDELSALAGLRLSSFISCPGCSPGSINLREILVCK